jgi:hypothetical protein
MTTFPRAVAMTLPPDDFEEPPPGHFGPAPSLERRLARRRAMTDAEIAAEADAIIASVTGPGSAEAFEQARRIDRDPHGELARLMAEIKAGAQAHREAHGSERDPEAPPDDDTSDPF